MTSLTHPLLGEIIVTKSKRSRQITAKVNLDGQLKIICPRFCPNRIIQLFIRKHQTSLLNLIDNYRAQNFYHHGDLIGKTSQLKVVITDNSTVQIYPSNNYLIVELNNPQLIDQPNIQAQIQQQAKKIIRKQAKDYLPQRLDFLAKKHNFSYQQLKLAHTSTRWGSYSTKNASINLNIALMKLPNELIDYVIIHELAHTKHPDHSPDFWQTVADTMPDYQKFEKQLKTFSPHV